MSTEEFVTPSGDRVVVWPSPSPFAPGGPIPNVASGGNLSGSYEGPYADSLPTSRGPCVHCQLLTRGISHPHEVLAVGEPDRAPVAVWFIVNSLRIVAGGREASYQWLDYRDWTIVEDADTYLRLAIPADCHSDGTDHTYVWRLVDRFYDAPNGWHLQLGIWAD